MKDYSFRRYVEDAWGNARDQQEILGPLDERMRDIEPHIAMLVDKLSHGDGPVSHAANRFFRSWDVLKKTVEQAKTVNAANPESGDHPPVSMDFNNS